MVIPKLSPRIGFCRVSIRANIQLMIKNAANMKTMH